MYPITKEKLAPDVVKSADGLDDNKAQCVKDKVDELISETSVAALSRIHRAKTNVKRIAWIAAFFGMFMYMSFQIILLCQQYFEYPVELQMKMHSAHSLEFPAVTICNLNPVRQSQLSRSPLNNIIPQMSTVVEDMLYTDAVRAAFAADGNVTAFMGPIEESKQASLLVEELMKKSNFNKWDAISAGEVTGFYDMSDVSHEAAYYYSKYASENSEEITNLGHDLKSLLISCNFAGHYCSVSNFTPFLDTDYGNCYTFNSGRNNFTENELLTTYPGPNFGLELELYVEQFEYVNTLAHEAGFRVLVHSRAAMPFMKTRGFGISPGSSTSVGVTLKMVGRMPAPYGDCEEFNPETIYSKKFGTKYCQESCILSCYQLAYLEECGCVWPFYIKPDDAPVCNMTEETELCLEPLMKDKLQDAKNCKYKCPSACKEDRYILEKSYTRWPSDIYKDVLTTKIKQASSLLMGQHTTIDVRAEFAKLNVYYKDLIYEEINETSTIEVENLISDIGGQLGLWLGLSFVTIGELIEFGIAISHFITKRRLKKAKALATLKNVRPLKVP